jgi:acyl carrier protein
MTDKSLITLQRLVAQEFGVAPDRIGRNTGAEDIDGWDSISHACLILAIEKHYGVRFQNEDIYTLSNVGELYDRIMELHSKLHCNG